MDRGLLILDKLLIDCKSIYCKPIFLILSLFFFSNHQAQSQTTAVDSIKNLLLLTENDTNKVNALNELSKRIFREQPQEAIQYCHQSINLSKAIKYDNGLAEAFHQLSWAHSASHNGKDSAIYYIRESIAFAEKANNYSVLSASYSRLSTLFEGLDDQIKAGYKALEYAELSPDKSQKVTVLHNLGLSYHIAEQIDKAREHYEASIALAMKVNHTGELNATYTNISVIYQDNGDYNTGLKFQKKALKWCSKDQFPLVWARTAANLGTCYIDLNMLDSAIFYLNEAEQIFIKYDSPLIQFLYNSKGYMYHNSGNCDAALPYLLKAHDGFKESYDIVSYHEVCEAIADCYTQIGDHKSALRFKDTILASYEKTYLEGLTEELAEANIKYETELKENQITAQELKIAKQKNVSQRTLISGILAFLLALIAFQYYFQKQKRKKQTAEYGLQLQQTETASLKKLDLLKTQFFTNISHELRTPLTLISGPLENALKKSNNTLIEKDIKTAYKQSNKLSNLVNELLDFSKLEAGKLEIQKHKTQLSYFIKRVFWAFESMADLREIKLIDEIDIDEQECVFIDDNKLEKILNNLINNALKFTGRKGKVRLNASIAKNSLQIEIDDSGNGIHPKDINHIFERFYQSEQKSEVLQGGTGIGLALCKELTELMKGTISVKSELGQGSTFTVELPIEKTTPNGNQNDSESFKDETEDIKFVPLFINGEKPKILIVEDNYEMSRYLNELLSKNYNCTVAYDGEEALKKLKQQNFDLISCDIMMPNMDGFTFRAEVNKLEPHNGIPFVMLTARAIEGDKLKGLQLGIDDYITKPFNKLELEARVQNLIQNRISRLESIKEEANEDVLINADLSFIQKAEKIVLKNISNTSFKVSDLASELNYSQRQLSRILKKSIGLSPVAYILEIRLQKARQLLEQKKFNSVKEVQYEIGIDSASYFASKFKERFGKSPSSYFA